LPRAAQLSGLRNRGTHLAKADVGKIDGVFQKGNRKLNPHITLQAIIDKLSAAINAVLQNPQTQSALAAESRWCRMRRVRAACSFEGAR
jgi:hypothetical protein